MRLIDVPGTDRHHAGDKRRGGIRENDTRGAQDGDPTEKTEANLFGVETLIFSSSE